MKLLVLLVLVLTLAGCSGGNQVTTRPTSDAVVISSDSPTAEVTPVSTAAASVEEALAGNTESHAGAEDYVWDAAAAVSITLNGSSITVTGEGVTVDGSTATITAAGTYNLSGALENGQIVVNTEDEQLVRLVLSGVNIQSSNSAPINIISAQKTVIILAENTQNILTDGKSYVYDDPAAEEPYAVIFSNSDLSISGSGSLSVNANFNDGISSDDGLVISSGAISVNAVDDGIRGKDYLVVENGNITVTAGGDGLKSDSEGGAGRGYILVDDGVLSLTAGGDAIFAQTDVLVRGGNFTISAGGGSGSRADENVSTKGIKGGVNINIDGGAFSIDAADDALHSNGNITINGGTFTITTADDGMHADAALQINAGSIQISRSYEGLESAVITLNGGDIHLVASDDGINVAGGADGSGFTQGGPGGGRPGMGGGPGQDSFAAPGDYHLYINGGYLVVDAYGDGIDANGAIEMTGGVVLVNGPTEQMNGPLDHAGFNLTGGYLVAAGSAGMAQAPDQASSQNSVLIYLSAAQPSGTLVHIQNSAGENILTFAPSKQYQTIAFSSAELVQGETYEIYLGGRTTGAVADSLAQDGAYSGGTLYTTFTVSASLTSVGGGGGGFRR